MRKLLSWLLVAATLSACGGNGDSSPDPSSDSSFILGVIPDTQFLSENNKRGFLNLDPRYPGLPYEPALAFYSMTEWLADHALDYRIPFVIHVGDIIQAGGEQPRSQWDVADRAMATLEARGVPYSISTGNHDVRDKDQFDSERTHRRERFLEYFSIERARDRNTATFIGRDPLGYSEVHRFKVFDQFFLVIAIDWNTSDATLAWVRERIAEFPNTPVILMSHNIVSVDGSTNTPVLTGNGERLWQQVIAANDQVFMTISGHNHYAARVRRNNDLGNSVDMILADYQDEYAGGNGLLRLLELDLDAGRVEAFTFSPWALQKRTEAEHRALYVACPTPEVTADCDQIVPEPNTAIPGIYYDNQYRFDLDFRARFASFNGYTASVGRGGDSLIARLRQQIADKIAAAP